MSIPIRNITYSGRLSLKLTLDSIYPTMNENATIRNTDSSVVLILFPIAPIRLASLFANIFR